MLDIIVLLIDHVGKLVSLFSESKLLLRVLVRKQGQYCDILDFGLLFLKSKFQRSQLEIVIVHYYLWICFYNRVKI